MLEPSHRFFAGKRLFIAGCGYVGGEVARQGLAHGLEVYALTRNPDQAAALRQDGMRVILADLADTTWPAQLPTEIDFVLNSVSAGGGGVEGYRRSYLDGMNSLLAWVSRARVGTCVYTSSTSVYPQGGGVTVDETAPLATDGDERVRVLIAAENLLRENAGRVGRAFVLRLAGIYGPGRHLVLDQIVAGGDLPGSGRHRLNLIHRDDAVAAIWAAFGAPPQVAGATYNVVDNMPIPKVELADWLAAQLGRPPPRFDASLPTRRGRATPDRVIANAKIKHELGWRPSHADYRTGYVDILAAL